jgi:AcrR family transcriptional regulator
MTIERGGSPRWRRRKEARAAEIIVAAGRLFADHGFAATKLDDIARKAGVSKGSIYLYFATKEDLFRAVVRLAVVPQVQVVRRMAEAFEGRITDLIPPLLNEAASIVGRSDVVAVVRMVIGESRNFPDLAKIWHDEIVSPLLGTLSEVIALAQVKGEVEQGDPRLYAFCIVGPLFMATMFRDVFGRAADDLPELGRLAEQHAHCLFHGLTAAPST